MWTMKWFIKRSVNFEMSFWYLQFFQITNEKIQPVETPCNYMHYLILENLTKNNPEKANISKNIILGYLYVVGYIASTCCVKK